MSASRPPSLPLDEVIEAVRGARFGSWEIVPTKHFWNRAVQRGVTSQDVLAVFENGIVDQNPSWNDTAGMWTYLVRGLDVESEPLAVRIAINVDAREVIVITPHA